MSEFFGAASGKPGGFADAHVEEMKVLEMQVTETLSDGLKRELKITVPAKDMESQMNVKLADAKDKVRINGFRPGKVPMSHLKKGSMADQSWRNSSMS